jgi:hypothetical protein
MRVRRRIPPLPRLGRQAEMTSRDDLAMNKLRRKRSTRDQALTSNLHLSDDVKQLAAYDLSDFDQRAAPLPRLGSRSIPLPRIGRVVDDLSPYEYGFEFGDYGVQSSLLPRIGYRTATVRAAPLPRIGRRSDDELGVVPFPRLGR